MRIQAFLLERLGRAQRLQVPGEFAAVEPAPAVASALVGAAIVCFAVVVWMHAQAPVGTSRSKVQPAGAVG